MDRDDDPLDGPGLRVVTLADRTTFASYFSLLSHPLSDYTFSQIYTWRRSLRIFWKELHGHLCIFANGTGDLSMLMPPIGDGGSDRALRGAFEIMDAYNAAHNAVGRSRIEYASEELLGRFDLSRLAAQPMGADYLYDVQRMIDLGGGDLSSKRQLKNRFLRNYEHRVEEFDRERHAGACLDLLKLWKVFQDERHVEAPTTAAIKRQKESLACELALDQARELDLRGLVVYVRGGGVPDWSLRGFTFGECLGANQSSIIIEKTDLEVRGLAQFIFSEFCRACWSDRPLVNAGDDWGLETLAWTKMSYRPVKMLRKYNVTLAPVASVAVPQVLAQASAPVASVMSAPVAAEAPASGAMVVRAARKSDLDAAVELENSCFDAFCLSKRQLSYLQTKPSALFLVAECDGRVVGEGISLVRRHKHGASGRIYSLAVGGAYRGRRIGQQLLAAMIGELAARGVKRVFLEVEAGNVAAIHLYERNGFRRLREMKDYYGPGRAGLHMLREAR